MLAHAVGLLLLTYAFSMAMLVAFAVLHGTAWGLRGPFMQAIRADYFGRSAIGMILGLSYMIIIIGQMGGPIIAGVFADAHRQLPLRLHAARPARRPGLDLLPACQKTHAAAHFTCSRIGRRGSGRRPVAKMKKTLSFVFLCVAVAGCDTTVKKSELESVELRPAPAALPGGDPRLPQDPPARSRRRDRRVPRRAAAALPARDAAAQGAVRLGACASGSTTRTSRAPSRASTR